MRSPLNDAPTEGHFYRPAVLATLEETAGAFPIDASDPNPSLASYPASPGHRPPATYPPPTEITALWRACVSCGSDAEVSARLEGCGLRPEWVDDFHLARALPATADLPAWASFRGVRPRRLSWVESGHRLLVPAYDAFGCMRSVRAWCVDGTVDPKGLSPAGYATRHLVLGCGQGVAMLLGGWERSGGEPHPRVVITEGELDFLTWATRSSDAAESVPIVLGVFAATWSDEFARRIPRGARVVVRTHRNPVGDAHAEAIRQSLEGHATVCRSRAT
jgi:hypothetical protein